MEGELRGRNVERETGTLLGTVDGARADSTVHDGAVYLHLGEQYLVGSLDHAAHVALVTAFDADYYTQVKRLSSTRIVRELETHGRVAQLVGEPLE
jgi:DEAD/DEAH box helicase domain-containing protein